MVTTRQHDISQVGAFEIYNRNVLLYSSIGLQDPFLLALQSTFRYLA
jgi:hypothetical protein